MRPITDRVFWGGFALGMSAGLGIATVILLLVKRL